MEKWNKIALNEKSTVNNAISILEKNKSSIVLVIDENDLLLGVITDGDIRSGLLKGINLNQSIKFIYNNKPYVANIKDGINKIKSDLKYRNINQVPVVNDEGKVVRIVSIKKKKKCIHSKNSVVLMAGGEGTRLKPLTEKCPKPLLKIGDKPVLEIIILKLIKFGFKEFFISVNYKSEMIEQHFGDGSKWDINIEYLREKKKLGTAGSLTLLPKIDSAPLLLMNADLLTNINFKHLIDYHLKNNSLATMCVRKYEFQIPFGVVNTIENILFSIEEKPKKNFFVNAGIYVIQPELIKYIPSSTFYDMPDLFNVLLDQKKKVTVYPIGEYWIDIGSKNDFEQANSEYHEFY